MNDHLRTFLQFPQPARQGLFRIDSRHQRFFWLGWLLLMASLTAQSQSATIRYVKAGGSGNGQSWETASGNLQAMIDEIGVTQVWVAQGVYKPGIDRNASFAMKAGVAIYGGFLGEAAEDELADRPAVNPVTGNPSSSTLSGELSPGTNSYHVINNPGGLTNTAVLDGFVITGGQAYGDGPNTYGGGMYNDGSSPSLVNCLFVGNGAGNGGGIININCSPTLTNCLFKENFGGIGGGMQNAGSSPNLTNCLFQNNSGSRGVGMANSSGSNAILINCQFKGNLSGNIGGGLFNYDSSPKLYTCSFQGNSAAYYGGAMYNYSTGYSPESSPSLYNCSFQGNTAGYSGGGVYNTGDFNPMDFTEVGSKTSLTNCVGFSNGGSNTFYNSSNSSVTASYSLFDEAVTGYNDDNTNLKTTTSPFISGTDLSLSACSKAINAGDPTSTTATVGASDLAGNPRIVGGRIDMGAYEYQSTPSQPLEITQQPASSSTVCQGATVTTSVSVTGTVSSYQWYKGGALLADQTSATLTLGNVENSQSGSYSVVITGCNSLTSAVFQLTVNSAGTAPVLSLVGTTLPILQNTLGVSLTITGCSGNSNWSDSKGNTGIGNSISVPTSTTGTTVYSATCTGGSCPSLPGSFTLTIDPPVTSGSFDGFINGADCGSFRGWAWDRNKPNTVFNVTILDGAKVLGTIPAGDFRQDLLDAGKGNGKHAFRFTIPETIKDGFAHSLSARMEGSSFILKDSPKAIVCQSSTTPVGNKPPVPPATILIAPLAAQVGVPFSGTLAAFTDPEGGTLSYGLTGLPDGLILSTSTRVISGTPTAAGNFALAYSATDVAMATNSVSFVLTVNPASTTSVTGSFEGYLDKVECGTIRGWVWDRNQPNAPVTVEFYTGSTVWGSTVANIYRADLKTAGKGNGNHAYSFEVPSALKDGNTRVIYGRIQGSTFVLKDSGKPLTCSPSGSRVSAEGGGTLSVAVLGNPVLEEVVVEIRGAGGAPLQMNLFDSKGLTVTERAILQSKNVEYQTFTLKNQSPGLFILRVESLGQVQSVKLLRGQ
ncbi:putative Ig domain-containing protein [Larkinella rosea]|uniref:Ig-like domain-containing protein n=1 Tax=Larkinella rosea TaxID=2025312 RepID=A0A3P1C2R7_9BACT|nr:putative Ig domain-containing protein [Larkinella rosea]RRB07353.1 hypothetical protein EHT25_06130 [Larkinella rosea]